MRLIRPCTLSPRTLSLPVLALVVLLGRFVPGCDAATSADPKSGGGAASTSAATEAAKHSLMLDHAPAKVEKVTRSEHEWRALLTPEQFEITREKGTEPAFHNAYFENHETGEYRCADCDLDLFKSDTKFESGTGWPSFWVPIDPAHVEIAKDDSFGMTRDEVVCSRCGAHLGHVFDDGPQPTGKRFCMDSASLRFVPAAVATPVVAPATAPAAAPDAAAAPHNSAADAAAAPAKAK